MPRLLRNCFKSLRRDLAGSFSPDRSARSSPYTSSIRLRIVPTDQKKNISAISQRILSKQFLKGSTAPNSMAPFTPWTASERKMSSLVPFSVDARIPFYSCGELVSCVNPSLRLCGLEDQEVGEGPGTVLADTANRSNNTWVGISVSRERTCPVRNCPLL